MSKQDKNLDVFCCSSSIDSTDLLCALDTAADDKQIKVIGLPCSGKITVPYLLSNGSFVVTAEMLPKASAGAALILDMAQSLGQGCAAVNVSDNPFGAVTSSWAVGA